jgi:hypothetical protein
VKPDRDVPGVSGEIGIGRENLQAVPDCDGADEQVRPGTLQSSLTKAQTFMNVRGASSYNPTSDQK